MANVGFKKGTQSNLETLMGTPANIEEGTFYLTSDTHRLYIGQMGANDTKEIVAVNQGIITVDYLTTSDDGYTSGDTTLDGIVTPIQGQFYYVINANILCVRSGNNWVQINPIASAADITSAASSAANTAVGTAIAALNPMKYKGTVSSADYSTKLTGTEEWGFVYMASTDFILPDAQSVGKSAATSVHTGDLVISQAHDLQVAEQASGNTVWAVVPSGNETPTAALTWGTFGS